jgi:hypothetical protein
MTGAVMIDLFNVISGKQLGRTMVATLLNLHQDKVIKAVHRHYTPNLDVLQSAIALGVSGEYLLTALTTAIWELHNGIDFIRPASSTTVVYRRISIEEYQRALELGKIFPSSQPKYYCRGAYIYCLPYTTGDTIDIYYRKAPTAIVDGATIPDVSTRIQDIILRSACMGINNDMYASALNDIKELNNTRPPTDTNFTDNDPLAGSGYDPSKEVFYRPITIV